MSQSYDHCLSHKKSKTVHHKFQRRLLMITWKDEVRNEDEDIREKTGLLRLVHVVKNGWLEHVGY